MNRKTNNPERHMGLIGNLPVMTAAAAAILAGLRGYLNGRPNASVYQSMCLFLVIFYIAGAILKNTITRIYGELNAKAAPPSESEPQFDAGLQTGTIGAGPRAGEIGAAKPAEIAGDDMQDAAEDAEGAEAAIDGAEYGAEAAIDGAEYGAGADDEAADGYDDPQII